MLYSATISSWSIRSSTRQLCRSIELYREFLWISPSDQRFEWCKIFFYKILKTYCLVIVVVAVYLTRMDSGSYTGPASRTKNIFFGFYIKCLSRPAETSGNILSSPIFSIYIYSAIAITDSLDVLSCSIPILSCVSTWKHRTIWITLRLNRKTKQSVHYPIKLDIKLLSGIYHT